MRLGRVHFLCTAQLERSFLWPLWRPAELVPLHWFLHQTLGWKPVHLKTATSLKPSLKASLRRANAPLGDTSFHQYMESPPPRQSLFGVYLFLNKICLKTEGEKWFLVEEKWFLVEESTTDWKSKDLDTRPGVSQSLPV